MRRFQRLCALLVPLLCLAFEVNVSGRWSGTIAVTDENSGMVITTPVEIQFTQQASSVSGRIGRARDRDAVPISKVRMEGNQIFFEAVSEETSGPCEFSLTVNGDSMEGDMTAQIDNTSIAGKVRATRMKN